MLNKKKILKNTLFLEIYYTIILVYDTFCPIWNNHLVHNLLLGIYAQFQSILYRTFLCVLSPSLKLSFWEKWL